MGTFKLLIRGYEIVASAKQVLFSKYRNKGGNRNASDGFYKACLRLC
jgi:hypothetical protein